MILYLATGNLHKLAELQAMLNWPGVEWRTLKDAPGYGPPEEDGGTFAENALIKAEALATFTGHSALADDSGLEVDALGGHPGVLSARYAGVHGDDAANNRKLLERMTGKAERSARFKCALAFCEFPGRTRIVVGACEGMIAESPRGDNGFGYDPLFIPRGHSQTFAELPAQEKNRLSHRYQAVVKAKAWKVGSPPSPPAT
jgi:XTP/dITP diphosphohydrolase